jgi:hypothetical protein
MPLGFQLSEAPHCKVPVPLFQASILAAGTVGVVEQYNSTIKMTENENFGRRLRRELDDLTE